MPPKRGRPVAVTPSTDSRELISLHGNLRVIPFTSERGAQWLVLAVGGINVADAVSELIGTEGADSVRLVIYGK